jgi:hypothetical protein
MEFQRQLLHVHAREVPHFHMFEMLPTTLIQRTQVGGVSRHRLPMDPLCASGGQKFLDSAPPMNRRTIPDHHQLLPRLYQQVLQKDHAFQTLQRFLPHPCVQLSRRRDSRPNRQMVAAQPLVNNRSLPFRSLGLDHSRQQIEARFIDTNQRPALPRRLPTQFGPHFDPPASDGRFVALDRPSDRNWRCPTQILQQTGNVILVVANPQFPLDNLGHTSTGPDFATEAIGLRSVPEKIRDLAFLGGGQLRRMTRRRMRPKRLSPAVLSSRNPLADSSLGSTQSKGDVVLRPTLLLEFPSTQTSPFSPVMWGWRRGSHTPILRRKKFSSLRSDQ